MEKNKSLISKVENYQSDDLDDVILLARKMNENERSIDIADNVDPIDLLIAVNRAVSTVGFYLVRNGVIDKSEIFDLLEKVTTDALIDLGKELKHNEQH